MDFFRGFVRALPLALTLWALIILAAWLLVKFFGG